MDLENSNTANIDSANNSPKEKERSESPVILTAEDIPPECQETLKGDRIGDTAYSSKFVIQTLIGLSDVEWNEDFEDNLQSVWDMSVEKDVVQFLFSVKYPSIACGAIVDNLHNGRLVEILIGLLV